MYIKQGSMVELQRQRTTARQKGFIGRIIGQEVVLAIEKMQEPQSNLEEKDGPNIFFFKNKFIRFHINSTRFIKPVK